MGLVFLPVAIASFALLEGGIGQSLFNLGTILVANENEDPNNYTESALKTINSCTKDGCVGRVWIYYSDVATSTQWGTISETGMTSYARNIICRQLGYKESNDSKLSPALNSIETPPLWLTRTSCGNAPTEDPKYYDKNNILQCNPEVCQPDVDHICKDHTNDLMISCEGDLHSNQHDYYDGEVFFCAPDEKPYGMQTSMGLLQIYIDTNTRGITIEDPTGYYFKSSKKDSFCRQLGFTQAVSDSLYTKKALSSKFSFSECFLSSWYDATQLRECRVDKFSTACFGCCFTYPDPAGCSQKTCPSDNLIAIACLYDSHNQMDEVVSNGYRGKCELKNEKLQNHDSVCGTAIPGTTYAITFLGVLVGVLFISSSILLALYSTLTMKNTNGRCNCIVHFCCFWCLLCRVRGYNRQPEGQGNS